MATHWKVLVAALLGAAVVGAVWLITSEDEDEKHGGKVRLTFGPGHADDKALLRKPFERAVRTVNDETDLPTGITVRVVNEAEAARKQIGGPTYVPEDRTVYFPYAFIDQSREDIERFGHPSLPDRTSDQVLSDAMVFALYHELTHGLIDTLDVPSVGGEESDADSLAAVLAIASEEGGQGQIVPLSVAALEAAEGKRLGAAGLADYANNHKVAQQREIDALCFVYGSDPERYRDLVGAKDGLPPQRAELCEFKYQRELRSWRRLLDGYLTERGLRPAGR